MYKRIVIGIDQSYTRTGVAICADGIIKYVNSIEFANAENHCEKRLIVAKEVTRLIKLMSNRGSQLVIIVERIRQFSSGVLSMDYIKSTGALIGAIIDAAYVLNVPVYSVDTRVWKAAVVGTVKPQANKFHVDPKKWPTIQWLVKNNIVTEGKLLCCVSNKTRNFAKVIGGKKYKYNDDAADACCLALYGFKPKRNLKREV